MNDGADVAVCTVMEPVIIGNNAIDSQSSSAIILIRSDVSQVTVTGNVGSGEMSGASEGIADVNGIASDFVNGHFVGAPPIDLFPAKGSALTGGGTAAYTTTFDLNGTIRNGVTYAGAYHFDSSANSGWILAFDFKGLSNNILASNPPTDLTTC